MKLNNFMQQNGADSEVGKKKRNPNELTAVEAHVLRHIESNVSYDGNFCQSQSQIAESLDIDGLDGRKTVGRTIRRLLKKGFIEVNKLPCKGEFESLILRPRHRIVLNELGTEASRHA